MITTSSLAGMRSCDRLRIAKRTSSFITSFFVEASHGFSLPYTCALLFDAAALRCSKAARDFAAYRYVELLFVPVQLSWFGGVKDVFSVLKRQFYAGGSVHGPFASGPNRRFDTSLSTVVRSGLNHWLCARAPERAYRCARVRGRARHGEVNDMEPEER